MNESFTKRSIGREQFEALNALLADFYQKTRCVLIMLADLSGLAIAQKGQHPADKVSVLASLAAGNFAATGEMAKLVDEENGFDGQFHEGKVNSLLMRSVCEEFFVTVIFNRETTFGMMRVLMDKLVPELVSLLSTPALNKPVTSPQVASRQVATNSGDTAQQEETTDLMEKLDVLLRNNN